MDEMYIETDLKKIRRIARKKGEEYFRFKVFIKSGEIPDEEIDGTVREVFEEVDRRIDCTECGNCCRKMRPGLDEENIEILSKEMGLPEYRFKEVYLTSDPGEPEYFFIRDSPCPFLKGSKCVYYGQRPKTCREYPHLDKEGFSSRMSNIFASYDECPIVYNVIEIAKDRLWHDRKDV